MTSKTSSLQNKIEFSNFKSVVDISKLLLKRSLNLCTTKYRIMHETFGCRLNFCFRITCSHTMSTQERINMNCLIQFTRNHFVFEFFSKFVFFSGKLNFFCIVPYFVCLDFFSSSLFTFPLKLSNNYFVFVLTIWWIKCGKLFTVNFLFVNQLIGVCTVYVCVFLFTAAVDWLRA